MIDANSALWTSCDIQEQLEADSVGRRLSRLIGFITNLAQLVSNKYYTWGDKRYLQANYVEINGDYHREGISTIGY